MSGNNSHGNHGGTGCQDHHDHEATCNSCCQSTPNPSLCQNLDEMNFERGIWQAALDDDVQRITYLIRSQNVRVDTTDSYGYTALHYAARNGRKQAAECLIHHGANVNCQTRNNGATPLHRAIAAGKPTMVQFLLCHGADVNIRDNDQNSAMDRALKVGSQEIIDMVQNRLYSK